MFFSKSILFAVAALASSVLADHTFTIHNYCGSTKRAHVKSSQFNYISGLLATNGGTYSVTVPSRASSMIVFGENGECPGNDGPGTYYFCFTTNSHSMSVFDGVLIFIFRLHSFGV